MFEVKKEKFSEKEVKVLDFWKKNKIFEKSVSLNENKTLFSFYDGPPFATGLPHYGHLVASILKDVIPRYKTMKGFFVPRRFGWDCHGLPVENEIEKAKELSGSDLIEEFGIANFNQECRNIVLRYTKEWEKTVNRIGRWVDFKNTYKTMDLSFMESVWWVFSKLFEKDFVYEGFKVMPFSYQLGTPISNFEANLNYKDVDDPSLTISFKLLDEENTYCLAWTTTPWTLISNLALAVGKNIDYVKVLDKKTNRNYILAKTKLLEYFTDENDYKILENFKGEKLRDKKYEPLFTYFADRQNAFKILVDDFVGEEEGTGIVHTAPAFGEVDFFVCKKAGIDIVCPVDNNGKFTKEIPEYFGVLVKDADKSIIKDLKNRKIVFKHSQIRHRYPFCWRSDTPLIYKAINTWFVSVEKFKDKIIKSNEQIHWVPNHIKEGRFGKWLENARDWAISRNRYWGTPIPIWRAEDGEIVVISSVEALEKKVGRKITDIHRENIDDLTFEQNGKTFKRILEVFDCWFESGSMPYAQNHYPFENLSLTERSFPADFIAEGLDQTRGWFYTLNVISSALFEKPAFKNVIVNGIVLAEDGNKMSKRLKNYPDPEKVINEYGADAIRLYLLHSPVVKGEDLKFSKKGVETVLRQILIPLNNSFFFLATYAKIYDWKPPMEKVYPNADIDKWIISLLNKLIKDVERAMDKYELSQAVDPFIGFIDQLTNWYIRRSRTRFWQDKDSQGRREAFYTLYTVLLTFSKIIAPFIPFIAEEIYQSLKKKTDPESVHLCPFPKYFEINRDEFLEKEMKCVQKAVSLGHSLRKEVKIKVRQPLAKAIIACSDQNILNFLKKQEDLIKNELNVKELEFFEDETKFVKIFAKPNFPILGKKIGKLLPLAKKIIEKFEISQISDLRKGKIVKINIDGQEVDLILEDVIIQKIVKENIAAKNDEEIALALDTEITKDLEEEGIAREIVNKLNTMRRDENFEVQDRIKIKINASEDIKKCFEKFENYITNETLTVEYKFEDNNGLEWDINGIIVKIEVEKV